MADGERFGHTHDRGADDSGRSGPRGDAAPAFRYTAELACRIEEKWQGYWERAGTFRVPNPGDPGFDAAKPKYYVLDMFPYPSGSGLHVGHPEGYTATDIVSRYMRMRGHNVLHPMGWDAFGLPAEQYAVQTGVHPVVTTRRSIDTFRRQLKRFGFSYDWSREFGTIDEGYYGWTQWIFLQLYGSWYDGEAGGAGEAHEDWQTVAGPAPRRGRARPIAELVAEFESGEREPRINPDAAEHGSEVRARRFGPWHGLDELTRHTIVNSYRLAYLGEQTVNWCPKLGTALANEEVIDGKSERGGYPVFRKPLRQWMLRITAYGDRLLEDLPKLDWPESTRTQQAEWIGRSEGAEITFEVEGGEGLVVYTTRPDTIFGATYMVVAPEHPLVASVLAADDAAGGSGESCAPGWAGGGDAGHAGAEAVRAYVAWARNRSDVERQEGKEKTGVPLGVRAINPATGERIPVWVADYVLWGYGSGAIMAVPAHDERDFEFAKQFGLPIRDVVLPITSWTMRLYAASATAAERESGRWLQVLADLLGVVNSASGARPEDVPVLLERVRGTRHEGGRLPVQREPYTNQPPEDIIGTTGLRRGVVSAEWAEAIESMGVRSFDDLRALVSAGTFSALTGRAYSGHGYLAGSSNGEVSLDGLSVDEAKARAVAWLETTGRGRRRVNYRLRDWLFSRQRYWGEPFPIVFTEDGRHWPVSGQALPVKLPPMQDYTPEESEEPRPLLAKASAWVRTTAGEAGVDASLLSPGTAVWRETNTMPGWAGSCWYYLRYCEPGHGSRFVGREAERYWMLSPQPGVDRAAAMSHGTFQPHLHKLGGVDLYVGGNEHAVLHLLYARFWHKVLFDLGEVSTPEPFHKLFHQGLITAHSYQAVVDGQKKLVPSDEVVRVVELPDGVEHQDGFGARLEGVSVDELPAGEPTWFTLPTGGRAFVFHRPTRSHATPVIAKMSKSLKNVVNPDEVIARFGADTFRLYEMYMGPLEASKPWNTDDTIGMFRFLRDLWRLCIDEQHGALRVAGERDEALERQLHRTIAKVGEDIERLAFNTAIAAVIELKNLAQTVEKRRGAPAFTDDQLDRLARTLAPLTPHLAEELWGKLGRVSDHAPDHGPGHSVALAAWPAVDPAMLRDSEVEIPVQVGGKLRGRIVAPADASAADLERMALADPKVQEHLAGKAVKKVIVVPGRLVNIIAG